MKQISVIIPVYNVEEYLEECLNSVLGLTSLLDAEIIIIDDGSTDGSSEIAARFSNQHDSIRYHKQENGGPGKARNVGIRMAEGKYLYFFDSDDIMIPEVIFEMYQLAESNGSELTVCGYVRYTNGKIEESGLCQKYFYCSEQLSHISKHPRFVYDALACNKLILREFYNRHNLSFPEGCVHEDGPIALQLYCLTNHVSICWKAGFLWRIRTGKTRSISQEQQVKQNLIDRINMIELCLDHLKRYNMEEQVRQTFLWKIFRYDLFEYIKFLPYMSNAAVIEYMCIIDEFAQKYLDDATLSTLPAVYDRLYKDIHLGDMEHLFKVINFKTTSYANIPYIYENDAIICKLPNSLFDKTEYEAKKELYYLPPTCQISSAEIEDGVVHIYGYIYQRRVMASDEYPQRIEANLVDNMTGRSFDLVAEAFPTPELTDDRGEIICHEDYNIYQYNYDMAGFHIVVDLKQISKSQDIHGDCFIQIYHHNVLSEGTQLLRGTKKAVQKELKKIKIYNHDVLVALVFDVSGSLIIRKTVSKENDEIHRFLKKAKRKAKTIINSISK